MSRRLSAACRSLAREEAQILQAAQADLPDLSVTTLGELTEDEVEDRLRQRALAAHVRVQASGSWSLDMQTAADPLGAAQAKLVLDLATSLRPPNSVALVPVGVAPDGYSTLAIEAVPDIRDGLADAVNAAIAFSSAPAETFDAAARWVDVPGPGGVS